MTFRFVFDVIRNQPGTFELGETFAALRKSSLDRNHDQTNSLDIQFGTDIAFFIRATQGWSPDHGSEEKVL